MEIIQSTQVVKPKIPPELYDELERSTEQGTPAAPASVPQAPRGVTTTTPTTPAPRASAPTALERGFRQVEAKRRLDALWDQWSSQGYQSELIPGAPPGSPTRPGSTIHGKKLGKIPSYLDRRDGLWSGFSWRGKDKQTGKEWVFITGPKHVARWKADGANILLRTGKWVIIDIDVKTKDAQSFLELAIEKIGDTSIRFRKGSNKCQLLYRLADGEEPLRKRKIKFLINGVEHAVELLGDGQQTLVEGTHPDGDQIEWCNGHPCERGPQGLANATHAKADNFFCAAIEFLELYGYPIAHDTGNKGAGGTAKAKPFTDAGHRANNPQDVFDIFDHVSCEKAFANADRDDLVRFLHAVKGALGGQHWDRVWAYLESYGGTEDYAEKIWGSISTTTIGWGWLEAWGRSLGYGAEKDFADPPPPIPDGAFAHMMARYVWCRQIERYFDIESHEFLSAKALNAANTAVAEYGSSGKNTAEAQFLNRGGRQVATTTYRPGEDLFVSETRGNKTLSAINQWRPSPVKPASNVTDDDVRPWLDHVELIFGPLGDAAAAHALNWCSFVLQKPGQKINHALVIFGETQGTGKDTVFVPLIRTVGLHNVGTVTPDDLGRGWTDFLKSQIVRVEEMMNFSRKEVANKLKPLIAAPPETVRINEKNLRQYDIPNIQNWIMFTNNPNALPIENSDRRYWVHRCLLETPREPAHYENLYAWYEAGGVEKVAGWLLQRDIAAFNPHAAPAMTEAKAAMIEASQAPAVRWTREQLRGDGAFAGRNIVTVRELQVHARQDFMAPQDVNEHQAAIALKSEKFIKSEHRVWLGRDRLWLWARGPVSQLGAEAMKRRYQEESGKKDDGPQIGVVVPFAKGGETDHAG